MASKLKLSVAASEKLNFLSTRLNIRKNVVCRIAFCKSINTKEPIGETITNDSDGIEFNKSTVIGSDELLFLSLTSFVQGKPVGDDFFNIYVRNHIERGLPILVDEYNKVNSPTSFLENIVDNVGE